MFIYGLLLTPLDISIVLAAYLNLECFILYCVYVRCQVLLI